jgi:hypothetical protein
MKTFIKCKAQFNADTNLPEDIAKLMGDENIVLDDFTFDVNQVLGWNPSCKEGFNTVWFTSGESISVDFDFDKYFNL